MRTWGVPSFESNRQILSRIEYNCRILSLLALRRGHRTLPTSVFEKSSPTKSRRQECSIATSYAKQSPNSPFNRHIIGADRRGDV